MSHGAAWNIVYFALRKIRILIGSQVFLKSVSSAVFIQKKACNCPSTRNSHMTVQEIVYSTGLVHHVITYSIDLDLDLELIQISTK